jgi:hypothetical protein
MVQLSSLLIFNLVVNLTTNPNGFLILKLSGLSNPQFMGLSSSFLISFMETQMQPSNLVCIGCKIAEITSGLEAKSTTSGDIQTILFYSSANTVQALTNITISNKLFAPIPNGGKYTVKLPPSVRPFLPVYC